MDIAIYRCLQIYHSNKWLAFKRLDNLASTDFSKFISGLVRIHCEADYDLRGYVEKEIKRALSSSSRTINKMQRKKWNGIEPKQKEVIRDKLIGTMENKNQDLGYFVGAVTTIAVISSDLNWFGSIFDMLQKSPSKSVFITSFKILENIADESNPIRMPDNFPGILESVLSKENQHDALRYAGLTFLNKIVKSVEKTHLEQFCRMIVEHELLLILSDRSCLEIFNLLCKVTPIVNAKIWKNLLEIGLKRQLDFMQVEAKDEKAKAIHAFFENLDELADEI